MPFFTTGMITEELLSFIRGQYAAGMSVDEMKNLLVAEGGWTALDIDEALKAIGPMRNKEVPPALPDISPTAEEDEYREANAITSVQYNPSFEVITPSEEGNIADASLTQDVDHVDDFLGIFSAHQNQNAKEEETSPPQPLIITLQTETSPALPVELPHEREPELPPPLSPIAPIVVPPPLEIPITFASRISAPQEPEIVIDVPLQETKEVISAFKVPQEAIPPVVVTPQHEIPPTSPLPQITPPVLAPEKAAALKVSAPVAPSPVTFDLAALRKSVADASAASASAVLPDAGKKIETKSVAELWLQGARNQANTTPSGGLSGVPVRPKILSKRTMSSDILLRGTGAAIPGMPALSVPEEAKKLHPQVETASGFKAGEAIKNTPSESGALPASSVPKGTQASPGAFSTKRIVSVFIGFLVLLALLGGGWYMFMKLRGPDLPMIYGKAFQQFLGATSFGYHGSAKTNLVLSTTATDGVDRSGTVEFTFDYAGLLANGASGFGDGVHHIKFKGGLHSGNFQWVTDLESDVRMIGTALYFHVLAFPETSNADPELFKTYWIKFDFTDIVKELALSGVSGEGYRGFGTGSKDSVFTSLIQQNLPFHVGARLPDETLPSGLAYHIELKSNPDQMIALAGLLYQKYTNADLTFDANQKLRLKDALAKLEGDVLIDQKTNTLLRLSIKGDIDDDILSVHVKGPLAFTFDFSDANKLVEVSVPTPMLTLEELRLRMDDYKKVKEKRTRDAVKQSGVIEIQSALEAYRTQKGRYPTFLIDLVSSGKLSTSTMSEITLKTYFYAAYVKPDLLVKSGLCTTKGKACAYYHLGVNFDDVANPLLNSDMDKNTELRGGDTAGCGGEPDVACYDVVPVPTETLAAPISATPVSTTTKPLNP